MISNFLCSSVVMVVMVITGDGDVFLSNDGETVTSRGGDTDTEWFHQPVSLFFMFHCNY